MAKHDAQEALFDAITDLVAKIQSSKVDAGQKAYVIRQLAVSYRLVSGGPQPGGGVVEAKH